MRVLREQVTVKCRKTEAELVCYVKDQVEGREQTLRKAVILCPGGGYEYVSDREADPVAMQFLAMDLQVFILYYSVAPHVFPEALCQLAAAVAFVRGNADRWFIDPQEIAVTGFSAGGHLAASLGVFWNRQFLQDAVGLEGDAIRPNRLILGYPVITSGEFAHDGSFDNLLGSGKACSSVWDREFVSLEKQAGPQVPPVFLWHTATDELVPVENSLLFAMALRRAGVSLEMHIFREGRHGLSLANEETQFDQPFDDKGSFNVPSCRSWISLVRTWLE